MRDVSIIYAHLHKVNCNNLHRNHYTKARTLVDIEERGKERKKWGRYSRVLLELNDRGIVATLDTFGLIRIGAFTSSGISRDVFGALYAKAGGR